MGFGKRSGGEPRPAPSASDSGSPSEGVGVHGVRTRVANHGGVDKGFIALAAGVVVLSAGAAMAAPSLLSMFGEPAARPISELVAGLDRDKARLVLASQAFPDTDGRAFMTSLANNFPDSHNRLLGDLADAALAGANRDDLVLALNTWGMEFGLANLEYAGRTGADGFDGLLAVASDALDVINAEAGGCTLDRMTELAASPESLMAFSRFGGPGYKAGMRASHTLVDLAARGRKAEKPDARLNADDESALQSVMFSFLTDSQMMGAMQGAMFANGGDPAAMRKAAEKIDVCQLGRSLIHKLRRLPSGTKSRLLAAATSGDLLSMQGPLMGLPGMGGMSPGLPAGLR